MGGNAGISKQFRLYVGQKTMVLKFLSAAILIIVSVSISFAQDLKTSRIKPGEITVDALEPGLQVNQLVKEALERNLEIISAERQLLRPKKRCLRLLLWMIP